MDPAGHDNDDHEHFTAYTNACSKGPLHDDRQMCGLPLWYSEKISGSVGTMPNLLPPLQLPPFYSHDTRRPAFVGTPI